MVLAQAFHSLSEHPSISRSKSKLSFAFVHHANQFLITDGYANRSGISEVAGKQGSKTGLLNIIEIHRKYRVPLNIHISGTLLESLAWHCPEFLHELESLSKLSLLELIGSSYGQNMMKFFSHEHNLRQLNEHLLLYENLLKWEPHRIKVFWVPERLWDTKILAPVLGDRELRNGGYKYVILDDRLLYSDFGKPSPRSTYDKCPQWDPKNFVKYEIAQGCGLSVIPIAYNLRQNIPPRSSENLASVVSQLWWLLDTSLSSIQSDHIALYADDMEKAAGVGWDPNGPMQYENFVKWISTNRNHFTCVKVGEWASTHKPIEKRNVERGTYLELMNDFGAGESFERWYCDPRWTLPYSQYYEWTERRVMELSKSGADPSLMELAWKVLLAMSWQSAWHTPKNGAHGDPNSDGGPSPWIKAAASHVRIAAITAEAANWMRTKADNHSDRDEDDDAYGSVDAYIQDIDWDGNSELIVRNNSVFSVFSPLHGGRLVYHFDVRSLHGGRLVIGNPIDDWNLLEDLHGYMDRPPNHPGAFADVGYEHDRFEVTQIERSSLAKERAEIRISLQDVQKNSRAFGLTKKISLMQNEPIIRLDYSLPPQLTDFSTEIGLSPDYMQLLKCGRAEVVEFRPKTNIRGWSNKGVSVWAGYYNDTSSVFWDNPGQAMFGHGYMLRITSLDRFFSVSIGVELSS